MQVYGKKNRNHYFSKRYKLLSKRDQLLLESKKSEVLLKDVFPEKIAKVLKNKGKIDPEYYESASILFADIVSFSKITPSIDRRRIG